MFIKKLNRPYEDNAHSSPFITHFKMNWGWAGSDNDSYFAKSGNWEITIEGVLCNFVYERNMIHNFDVIE